MSLAVFKAGSTGPVEATALPTVPQPLPNMTLLKMTPYLARL